MADLGVLPTGQGLAVYALPLSIGPRPGPPIIRPVAPSVGRMAVSPAWYGPLKGAISVGGPQPVHKLAGRVVQRDEENVDHPLAFCRVSLFHRKTRIHVARTRTDANGYFQFNELMPGAGLYFAVAFDPEYAPVQNALILDLLTAE